MGIPESKDYVLKPYKSSVNAKISNQVPTLKKFLDSPAPEVVFEGQSFCFTGNFIYSGGDRAQCEAAVRARGGYCYQHPTRHLSYLVVGTFANSAWAHKSYGRKIEAAIEFKGAGANCKIISEVLWASYVEKTPELPKAQQTAV